MWVSRRFGYSERENPHHLLMVMAGAEPLVASDSANPNALSPEASGISQRNNYMVMACIVMTYNSYS